MNQPPADPAFRDPVPATGQGWLSAMGWLLGTFGVGTYGAWLAGAGLGTPAMGWDFRAYYAARNQAWFDKNVWARSQPMYSLNRYVFHTLLKLFARDDKSRQRLALIRQAVQDGETGALGINRSYPL